MDDRMKIKAEITSFKMRYYMYMFKLRVATIKKASCVCGCGCGGTLGCGVAGAAT